MAREQFKSRLGFILISAGCAIGLGNVWRFPYICGEYGGAAFVLMYVVFLVMLALPVLIMEFAHGRASQKGIARGFDELEPAGTKWHVWKWAGLIGSYLLMMFYTVVAGWMVCYMFKAAMGEFEGVTAEQSGAIFGGVLSDPLLMTFFMLVVAGVGIFACRMGVQKGIERITSFMMVALLFVMVALCINSFTLPGIKEGLEFYLVPNFDKMLNSPDHTAFEAVYAALGQAFFTVSVGIGSMSIFGSYVGKERSLTGEAMRVAGLDTLVALMAGLIIFPACFSFGVEPGAGPGLVFVTLPTVFAQMPGSRIWATMFFLFMSFAALSTIIAVFENIMAFSMDQWGLTRKQSVFRNGILICILCMPCILGYSVFPDFAVPGIGDVQSVEDFILSNNLLPIGAMVFLLFCTRKSGWGWDNFIAEVNAGQGMRFPVALRGYISYVIPIILVVIFVMGWIPTIQTWFGLA